MIDSLETSASALSWMTRVTARGGMDISFIESKEPNE